jgi:hypothetical protein
MTKEARMTNDETASTRSEGRILALSPDRPAVRDPGSQRPRSHRDVQINSAVPMHWYALRAGTASRSGLVASRTTSVAVSRCAPRQGGIRVSSFVILSDFDIRISDFLLALRWHNECVKRNHDWEP